MFCFLKKTLFCHYFEFFFFYCSYILLEAEKNSIKPSFIKYQMI